MKRVRSEGKDRDDLYWIAQLYEQGWDPQPEKYEINSYADLDWKNELGPEVKIEG